MVNFKKINSLSLGWRLAAYVLIALVFLAAVYGVVRSIQLWQGNQYSGDRGPYLQMPAPTAMTLRWQTARAVQGVVHYGLRPDLLDQVVLESEEHEEHELRLSGLKPATKYYYAVGSGDSLQSQYTGPDYWFVTPLPAGAPGTLRFAVLGDPGKASKQHLAVRDRLLDWATGSARDKRPPFDFIISTGDNAYRSGTNEEFQKYFFDVYERVLANTPIWPGFGNHDARRGAFFKVFTFPENGESGGVASGTENYFAFDYGDVHVVMLDSFHGASDADGDMLQWLRRDLAANNSRWLIAVFHHPPYSKGSHDSDDLFDSRGRMFEVRENLLPVLEEFGVDMVLNGHSHSYERSYLVDCHYGTSDTFRESSIVDRGVTDQAMQARVFRKSTGAKGHQGELFAVVGSTSKLNSRGAFDHPVMDLALAEYGALIVDIDGDKLVGRFITDLGEEKDRFVLVKEDHRKTFVSTCR